MASCNLRDASDRVSHLEADLFLLLELEDDLLLDLDRLEERDLPHLLDRRRFRDEDLVLDLLRNRLDLREDLDRDRPREFDLGLLLELLETESELDERRLSERRLVPFEAFLPPFLPDSGETSLLLLSKFLFLGEVDLEDDLGERRRDLE